MRTVGEMLREARLNKSLTLEQVEKATRIRLKFLTAIESDDYTGLPSLSYAKGFVKNYSEFLGLDATKVLAFFRRQTIEAPRSSLLPKGMAEPLNRTMFQLTPGKFLGGIIVCLIGVFLLYFGVQYRKLQLPPTLSIDSPKNQTMTTEKRVQVLGQTDTDATVTINGMSVLVRSDGKFFDQVALDSGVNKITIMATSRYGKTNTVTREVGLGPTEGN